MSGKEIEMERYYYHAKLKDFNATEAKTIYQEILGANLSQVQIEQNFSWREEVEILQQQLADFSTGDIFFEYTIPRVGKRVDVVVIITGVIFLIEFKVGAKTYDAAAKTQIIDYALNLNDFHAASHGAQIVPILLASDAPDVEIPNHRHEIRDHITEIVLCNRHTLNKAICQGLAYFTPKELNAIEWSKAPYQPTPTIIEAAQALYRSHNVEAISRNDAHAKNLRETTEKIYEIIKFSKNNKKKSICFVTGVPGSGKTLAGLNMATQLHDFSEDLHAVFLSGNGPLVKVLRGALVQDVVAQNKAQRKQDTDIPQITKGDAEREVSSFIQNIYHFRNAALENPEQPPIEKIAIFDEAQRAWDKKELTNFMQRRKDITGFDQSEPEYLISCLDRHPDWAVIVCLVGGGQSIHRGEAGIKAWFEALKNHYTNWRVFAPPEIAISDIDRKIPARDLLAEGQLTAEPLLHLSVSLRSFRAENVSNFVRHLLDGNYLEAKINFDALSEPKPHSYEAKYPIVMTRNMDVAREWIQSKALGSERYGIVASSTAKRLRPEGVWVDADFKPVKWFLDEPESMLSSNALEISGSEFNVQGLELDWAIVCIDADIRATIDPMTRNASFEYKDFRGNNWCNENEQKQEYTKNAYRVLLTRARMGMVIFIPKGDPKDQTRLPEFYEGFYQFLKSLDVPELLP